MGIEMTDLEDVKGIAGAAGKPQFSGEWVKLGELCDICSGGTPKRSTSKYWNEGSIPWVKISDISNKYVYSTEERITEEGLKCSSAKMLAPGTLLYSIFASIGAVGILKIPATTNQAIAGLSIKTDKIDRDYLYHFLKSREALAKSSGRGAAQNNINLTILRGMEVPVPPIDEQKSIAGKLEEVTAQIEKAKSFHDQLNSLVKSRFVEMFGRYNDNPDRQLQDVSEFVTVGIANAATHAYADTGVVMLRNLNVRENYLDDTDLVYIKPDFAAKYRKKALRANDILVTRTGYPGIACVVPEKYEGCQTFTTLIVRLREDAPVTATYVSQLINSPLGKEFVEKMKAGSSQQNFGATSLKLMPVGAPPLTLQQEFAAFVQQVDKLRFDVQQQIDKLELLKNSLMQEYFG